MMRSKRYKAIPQNAKVLVPVLCLLPAILFRSIGLLWPGLFALLSIFVFAGVVLSWRKWKGWWPVMTSLMAVFLIALGFRLCIGTIELVPSASMCGAVFPGDLIWVNKMAYGPALPHSWAEVPYVNLLFPATPVKSPADRRKDGAVFRLPGYATVQRNDLLVFRKPGEEQLELIKRCVGLPGDTLLIRHGAVFVSERLLSPSRTTLQRYRLKIRNPDALFKLNYRLHLDLTIQGNGLDSWAEGALTQEQQLTLLAAGCVDSVTLIKPRMLHAAPYSHYEQCRWTINDFGPVLIPRKGMTVMLTAANYSYLKNLLNDYEQVSSFTYAGRFYINGQAVKSYTFQNDYYFVLGDNRYDSQDSRFWGLLPMQNLVGRTRYALASVDLEKGIQWERLFARLR